ncbi:MAG: hypothetical protein QOH24_1523 [Verrucomicrobiota bacterium]
MNLYTEELGNSAVPEKFKQSLSKATASKSSALRWAVVGAVILVIGGFGLLLSHYLPIRAARSESPVIATIPEKSIAVLPFQSLSKDEENAFFADGVQDEILTDLAKVADLKVISRTSVMPYKNAAARNLREIAQQLGVAHVLEGSVQRAKQRVRINAQLIDARNDAHLWAQTYDRDLADVFAIQSEIAQAIAEQLQAHLSPAEKAEIAKAPTTDLVANDLYLRAKALDSLSDDPGAKESLLQAARLLDEAVVRDPKFLLAYCLLCAVHLDLYWGGFDHTSARRDLANAALENASRLQPDAGEVHLARAIYAYHGFRDYDRARAELDLARRMLPNEPSIYMQLGAIDRRQGRWDESIRNFDRGGELDPRNFSVLEEAAFTRLGVRRFAEARPSLERALSVSPHDYFVRTSLAQLAFFQRADTGPWRAQLTAIVNEGPEAAAHVAFALVTCALAERDSAAATRALTFIPPEGLVDPYNNVLLPREWFVGLVGRSFGDANSAQTAFAAARKIVGKTVRDQPEYAAAWSCLGMIDAGLGRKEDAIREGRRACELLPLSNDT